MVLLQFLTFLSIFNFEEQNVMKSGGYAKQIDLTCFDQRPIQKDMQNKNVKKSGAWLC